MNIRQLQFFYRTERTGTFSAAAREYGVTVQAVSKSIHELEEELGSALFVREGRGMRLTPLGETSSKLPRCGERVLWREGTSGSP